MRIDETIRAAARRFTQSQTPLLDARVLAKHVLGLDDAGLILAGADEIDERAAAQFEALADRRARGESVSHIIGAREFCGLTFELRPGVLSPRPDTETLIDAAIRRLPGDAPLQIADLGLGSGCILAALLSRFPYATGVGVDVSSVATDLARDNLGKLGFGERALIVRGDWGRGLAGGFDLLVSNPPYIPRAEAAGLPPEVRDFEDPRALYGGEDGLAAYREIFADAPRLVRPGGLMLLEFGLGQDEALGALLEETGGFAPPAYECDLSHRRRVLVARRAG